MTPIKILFLAANPSDKTKLRLDKEIREIDQALQAAKYREHFKLEQHHAVSTSGLQELLLRHQPHILHFSGHGSPAGEIILEADNDRASLSRDRHLEDRELKASSRKVAKAGYVSSKALAKTIGILKDNIRCVVLNACYSQKQAKAISKHIDVVVGMSTKIGDTAAISFSSSFYQALGYGRSLQTAFDLGTAQIDIENLDEQDTPQIIAPRILPKNIHLLLEKQKPSTSINIGYKQQQDHSKVIDPLLIYNNGEQQRHLKVTPEGLALIIAEHSTEIQKWVIDNQELKSVLKENSIYVKPDYIHDSGLLSIGTKKDWLYSKTLFKNKREFIAKITAMIQTMIE